MVFGMKKVRSSGTMVLPLVLMSMGLAVTPAAAWGGLFNRFSPEMLSNLGYGGHRYGGGVSAAYGAGGHNGGGGGGGGSANGLTFGGGVFRSAPFTAQRVHPLDLFEEEVREAEEAEAEEEDGAAKGRAPEPCYGRKCAANEHCCPGSVCVDVDGVVGSCLFSFGLRQGELCRRDGDCESGLLCAAEDDDDSAGGPIGRVVSNTDGRSAPRQVSDAAIIRTCQPPTRSRKLYGEECLLSSECDISKGLCCQLQRRHRQAPRKVCSYFKDSLTCIGPVAEERVKETVRHTAGEKRITGKAGSFGRIRK